MSRGTLIRIGFSMLGALAPVMHAAAQDAAEDRATSFKAVTGAVKEDVPGGPLLLGAYGAILVVIISYGVRLVRMQQRAQTDLARLERQIAAGATPHGADDVAPSNEQSSARK
jgi:high-affinity nickel permease